MQEQNEHDQLQSPMKQRPQSGGPSPDRHKLASTKVNLAMDAADSDTSSFVFMRPKLMTAPKRQGTMECEQDEAAPKTPVKKDTKQIFEDSREASIAIFKA